MRRTFIFLLILVGLSPFKRPGRRCGTRKRGNVEKTKRPSWTMERVLGEIVRGLVLEGLEEGAMTRRGQVVAVGWLCRLYSLLSLVPCRVCDMLLP
jgi:hypothetical protein